MAETHNIKVIARLHSDFETKFGVPRQSGLVDELRSTVVFEPEYRNADAVRGLDEFSHIWLVWQFSRAVREDWSPTVRPPRLGGNQRIGVFATRSPFRPNALGLSSVRLERVEYTKELGPVLHVAGADLMDGTPIYDIKPYIAYADSHADARGGFVDAVERHTLTVNCGEELLALVPETMIVGLGAGLVGIGVTLVLIVPINAILLHFTGIEGLKAALPVEGGVILVVISALLTLAAGLIPSRVAAKKDPVVALRTE